MAVTVHDVAEKAGVAVGTVSRFLNGYRLREQNRRRIEQAIKELGYKENIMARGLKRKRSMTIAVLTPDFDIFVTSIITMIEQMTEHEKYSLITCDFQRDPKRLKTKLLFLKDRFVDGLILFPSNLAHTSISLLKTYSDEHIPIVLIDHPLPGFETDTILIDNAKASSDAVETLIRHNHQKIAIINGRPDSYVSQERLQGYAAVMRTYHLPVPDEWVVWGDFTQIGGYQAVKALYDLQNPPTAIYVTNYAMTVGAVLALNRLHVRIPEDVSLIGFDHFESIDLIEPRLTMVEQPITLIAQNAAQLIFKRIRGDYSDFSSTIKLNTNMILGDSVRMM